MYCLDEDVVLRGIQHKTAIWNSLRVTFEACKASNDDDHNEQPLGQTAGPLIACMDEDVIRNWIADKSLIMLINE